MTEEVGRSIIGATLAADAENGEVVQVCFEFVLLLEGDADGFKEAMVVYVEGGAAVSADYVVMSLVVGNLILVGPAAEVYFDEQALAFEQLDGAVYGGDVYERVCLFDLFVDILGGHVARAGRDGGKDHHPLRREAETGASEGVEEFFCFGQFCLPGKEALSVSQLKEL